MCFFFGSLIFVFLLTHLEYSPSNIIIVDFLSAEVLKAIEDTPAARVIRRKYQLLSFLKGMVSLLLLVCGVFACLWYLYSVYMLIGVCVVCVLVVSMVSTVSLVSMVSAVSLMLVCLTTTLPVAGSFPTWCPAPRLDEPRWRTPDFEDRPRLTAQS